MGLDFTLLVTIRNAHFSISFSVALTALHGKAKNNVFELLSPVCLDKFCVYSIFITRQLILTTLKEKGYNMCLECKKKEEIFTLHHTFSV